MLWIVVGLILIVAVIVSPAARRVVPRLLGIAILVAVLLYVYVDTERRTRERQELAARQRIPHSVELSDLHLDMKQFGKLTGRVKNHDRRSTLTRIELLVVAAMSRTCPGGISMMQTLLNDFPVRGGIGYGKYLDIAEEPHVLIVSEAVVNAALVVKTAKHPCFAVHTEIRATMNEFRQESLI